MTAMLIWRLVHTFGFISWFVGLLATTGTQVAARKAPDASGRQVAWASMRRFVPYEIVGMILPPIGGLLVAKTVYGSFMPKGVLFVHIKLLLVIIAIVMNVLLLIQRAKAEPLVAEGGAPFAKSLKRMAMFQGIATMMLPLAVVVVILLKYKAG
jgi:uncharacterized membrane protein